MEELSQDDQIVAQAQRMGIEIPEGMSREQKVQAVRLKMREMIVTEAHRRAGAPVAEGDAAAFEAANLQNMQQAQAQANPNEDGDTDEEDEDDEGDHLDEPLAPVLNDPREMLAGLLGMPGMPGMQGEGGEPNAGQEQQAAVGMAQQQIMAEMRATADMGEDGLGLGGYQAKSRFGEFVDTFTGLVCAAQEFVREFHGGERSSASLRDVARCIKVRRFSCECVCSWCTLSRQKLLYLTLTVCFVIPHTGVPLVRRAHFRQGWPKRRIFSYRFLLCCATSTTGRSGCADLFARVLLPLAVAA